MRHLWLVMVLSVAVSRETLADRADAERLEREGQALLEKAQREEALAVFERAVEADPTWSGGWFGRARAKTKLCRYAQALEDLGEALERSPGSQELLLYRAGILSDLDRWQESAQICLDMIKLRPNDPYTLRMLGRALYHIGAVDEGIRNLRRSAELDPRNQYHLTIALVYKGDWKEGLKLATSILDHEPELLFEVTQCQVALGNFDAAAAAVDDARKRYPSSVLEEGCVAWLASTPGASSAFQPERGIEAAQSGVHHYPSPLSFSIYARSLFHARRYHECRDLLAVRPGSNFHTLFWLGASLWKLDDLPAARAALSDARRLNPFIANHAADVPGLAAFLSSIDSEIATEEKTGDPLQRNQETATYLFTSAEIESLVRRYQFSRAAAEYGRLLKKVKSDLRRTKIEQRLKEVQAMAGAMTRLLATVSSGKPPLRTNVGSLDLQIRKATEEAFSFTITGGEGKFPWACLDIASFVSLARLAPLTPDDRFGLGCIAWEAGDRAMALKLFEEAAAKKKPVRALIDAFVARQKGVPVPKGGFLVWNGTYVSAEEKSQTEKGLVLFQGEWVTKEDREKLAKGMRKVGSEWIEASEAELLARGFRKRDGKWLSPEEMEAQKGNWDNAWVEETEHYTIRTNESEVFAKELAALIEVAWKEFKAFHGGKEPKLPAGTKMTLLAFRDFEGYRQYCVAKDQYAHLASVGFAFSASNTVVGWNKMGQRKSLLATMVHEASHLYYFRVCPGIVPPSWYAEALATYFEGFDWDGQTWKFDYVSDTWAPFVREAMAAGQHIPLKDLVHADASQLLNHNHDVAMVFYAECWSLNYYLCQTGNEAYRKGWIEFRKALDAGEDVGLGGFFPDLTQLEKDWIQSVTGK